MIFNEQIFKINTVTEAAAIACHDWVGKHNNYEADRAAVNAMRKTLATLDVDAEIVIGEGERDKAPMLYIGEKIRGGKLPVDIAVDPLEGTNLCANSKAESISVIAMAPKNTLLKAPDCYMKKIAVGVRCNHNLIDINDSITANVKSVAKFKGCTLKQLTVVVLKRERHVDIIEELQSIGVKIKLINDGDIVGVLATTTATADLYIGIGGAPEGVIAAAALKCLGGQMQCKLILKDNAQIERALSMGISNHENVYHINDMVRDDVIFCATGVTDGTLVRGVTKTESEIKTHSFIASFSLKKNFHLFTSHHYNSKHIT